MRIVFNTHFPQEASSRFYRDGLQFLPWIDFSRWDDYADYDIALFMTHRKDLESIAEAKRQNPNIKVGIVDARGRFTFPYMKDVDFLILDSLEMRDFFARFSKPILTYSEYPRLIAREKVHAEKKKIIIGYHGNKIHLSAMYPNVTSALDALAERHDIELWAVYNMKELGMCRVGLPKRVSVRHIQWHEKVYEEELAQVDIGICPSLMPIRRMDDLKKTASFGGFFLESADDYLLRFKMPSNPGRIIVFGLLGIPVVADFLPSSLQLIQDGRNGFVAHSAGGWYSAINALIVSVELRRTFGHALQRTVLQEYGNEVQNQRFESFCRKILAESPGTGEVVFHPEGAVAFEWSVRREQLGRFYRAALKRLLSGK